ncbi:MAG: ABC-type transport auxiliary lipoprotein family protein [Desulfovibrionaceae bacterium]|nr:ABC-type transport auxiliary lipoprotein family protein [Desulfovibrionaceae bacterium]
MILYFLRVKTRLLPLLLCCCMLWAGGCVNPLNPGPPPVRLQLSPAMPERMAERPLNRQLIVAMPVAGREIDADTIALLFHGREVRILADARWTGTVPFIVQRSLIRALESANALSGVADESAGIASDARLLSDIRQFSLHYADEGARPVAVFSATFRLLSLSSGQIIGVHDVDIQAPADGRDNTALARAMETALGQGLAQVVPWVVEEMRGLK